MPAQATNTVLPDPVVITAVARTPIGDFMGALSSVSATVLGTTAIHATLNKSGLDASKIQAVNMGCVLSAGLGQAPARQAALGANIPDTSNCLTLNKMCGSGLQAVMLAHDALTAGTYQVMLAGGMESMSNAPYLLPKARDGYRMGHGKLLDHMMYDGLEDVYQHQAMGVYAEATAEKYGFNREQQDEFALRSLQRAVQASNDGSFTNEIAAVTVKTRNNDITIDSDEHPFAVKPEKIPKLKPAFAVNGSVTAANSSAISDGAAALTLMPASVAKNLGCTPLARIIAHTSHSQAPEWFTTAPVGAIRQLLSKTGWSVDTVDLFEINEAFAVVAMAAQQELNIPDDKLNVHGGACALGHPIGASGARILVTLISALHQYQLKRGIAALCIGGGEAVAIAVERA